MNQFAKLTRRIFALGVATTAIVACSAKNDQSVSGNTDSKRLVPESSIATKADGSVGLFDQLKRFRGQTSFLVPGYASLGGRGGPMAASAESATAKSGAPQGGRSEQESDIFKIGKQGSKMLYLLNNNRGLQTISFAGGADKPELLGRVKATGNYPDDMYYDQKNDRMLVLERLYYAEDGSYNYSEVQSRIVIYDVSTPSEPRIAGEVPVEGMIADSRIVGDVLYIASSLRPDSSGFGMGRSFDGGKQKGIVTSFNFSNKEIKEVAKMEMSLPSVYGEQMNIQTVQNADGSLSYYLVAILSETGWGWADRQSLVEVVDISDANGAIRPVMTVSAKGSTRERSQTLIKDGTLLVTSNYISDATGAGGNPVARIAVESFVLPKAGVRALSEKEATVRKLQMEIALEGKQGEEYDKARKALLADPNTGLQGQFVTDSEGKLRKFFPDSVVTVGDTKGMSSQLQDVRYQDGLLYAFWVPANNIDPLDVFDISNPQAGVKHLTRLEFDGWISKAIPVSVGGRTFIVGLGWVVPAVDNERNMRHPQASIFEIKKVGAKYKVDQLSQLTFENSNTWTDFNSPDRFIEVRFDGEGKGQILFAASYFSSNDYQSGGKVLNFNVNEAATGDADKALAEGPFLSGRSGWLRRVFTNDEIERVNTFSDQALAVYNVKQAPTDKMTKATAVLELARNIRGYETLTSGAKVYGVQIISDWSWYGNGDEALTSLRLVDAKKADSEKEKTVELSVPGSYIDSLVQGRTLYVLTSKYESKTAGGKWSWSNTTYVHAVDLGGAGLNLVGTNNWTKTQDATTGIRPVAENIRLGFANPYAQQALVATNEDSVLVQVDDSLKVVNGKTVSDLTISNCITKDRNEMQVKMIDDVAYFTSVQNVEVKELGDRAQAQRHFVSPAVLANGVLKCGQEINIPGRLVTMASNGAMITDDTWLLDVVTKTYSTTDAAGKEINREYKEVKTTNSLVGLTVTKGVATLVDEQNNDNDRNSFYGTTLASVQAGQVVRMTNLDGINSRPFFRGRGGWNGQQSQEQGFEFISVGADGFLSNEVFALNAKAPGTSVLMGVVADPSAAGSYFGVVQTGRKVQVVQWSKKDHRPTAKKLVALDEKLKAMSSADSITAGGYTESFHYTPSLNSFELVGGLNGITQFFVK